MRAGATACLILRGLLSVCILANHEMMCGIPYFRPGKGQCKRECVDVSRLFCRTHTKYVMTVGCVQYTSITLIDPILL